MRFAIKPPRAHAGFLTYSWFNQRKAAYGDWQTMTAVSQDRSAPWTAAVALARLADRPGCLLALLLALNALARPYANLVHDARLYSVQVLNHLEHGAYNDDLFLRYGSQDQFSIFSCIVAPLVGLLGLRTAFFLLYLLCNTFFYFALIRLVRALVPDRAVGVAALLFVAVASLPFGGLNVFVVNESFLTPRILANSLVILALERILNDRYFAALGLIVAAMLMHPLMAFGGLLIWAGCLATARLNGRLLAVLLMGSCAIAVAVLAFEPLGVALFGRMDPEWREMVRDASAYNFPSEWTLHDWVNLSVSLAVPVWALVGLPALDSRRRRLIAVAIAVGIAGMCGTALGAELPYALLFQGQPYRALWILKLLEVPLGFCLIRRWAGAAGWPRRVVALGLLFYFSVTVTVGIELVLPLFVLAILLVRAWAVGEPLRGRVWRLAAFSVIATAMLWSAFKWCVLVIFRDALLDRLDALDYAQRFIDHLGPCAWLLGVAMLAVPLTRLRPRPAAFAASFALAALGYQAVMFVVVNAPDFRAAHTQYGADVAFTRDFLARRQKGESSLPTVYSDWGRIDYVWVDLHTKSYFDWAQVVGVLFNRQTAAEGRRRAALVSRFEMQRLRKEAAFIPEPFKEALSRLFHDDFDGPPPTLDDIARLCEEPGLDYVVVRKEFPGLVAADNGRVFIYECRQVRAALGRSAASPALADARSGAAPASRQHSHRDFP